MKLYYNNSLGGIVLNATALVWAEDKTQAAVKLQNFLKDNHHYLLQTVYTGEMVEITPGETVLLDDGDC